MKPTSYYVLLDTSSFYQDENGQYITNPKLPVLKVNNKDLDYCYKLLSPGNVINSIFICSLDLDAGLVTGEYADYPTKENNWSDS